MMPKKTETLSFKVTPDFKQKITNLAKEENRTISNLVIKILTEYITKVDEAKRILKER